MPLSVATANSILTARTASPMYLALLTVYPSWTDTGSSLHEPAAVDYSRHYLDPAYWDAPLTGVTTWNFDITYLPVNDWGTIIAFALCSAASAGNLEAYEYLAAPISMLPNSTMRIASGMITYGAQ